MSIRCAVVEIVVVAFICNAHAENKAVPDRDENYCGDRDHDLEHKKRS